MCKSGIDSVCFTRDHRASRCPQRQVVTAELGSRLLLAERFGRYQASLVRRLVEAVRFAMRGGPITGFRCCRLLHQGMRVLLGPVWLRSVLP